MPLKIEVNGNRVFFLGKATIKNIELLPPPTLKPGTYEVEFERLEVVDSAFIAWLLDWQKSMLKKNIFFKYTKLPIQFENIVAAYRLQSLFEND